MATLEVNTETMDWGPGSPIWGPDSIYRGRELVEMKVLSDRRAEGGGIALMARFLPPPGKAIRIVAVARSEEHSFDLEGGRGNKSGAQLRFPGSYAMNATGNPHSAIIAVETVALIVYSGEPDEIRSMDVIDIR
jgi:hypothetical protein